MWVKYNDQVINLSMQTRIKKGKKFPNELIFSDYKYKFSFENEEKRDKAFNLIKIVINIGYHQPISIKNYLLDLDKKLKNKK